MRDQPTSNRECGLTAIPRIGSGDWLGHWQRTKYMKIGDKVVCVNDAPCNDCGIKHGYIKNNVYVISAVRGTDDGTGSIGVRCIGVNCHPNCGTGWNSSRRFRLLDELKEQNANKQQAQVA